MPRSRPESPADADRLFLWLLGGHIALWTLVPALTQPNPALDVIEQFAWGREWQIAYFKHPPLPAWSLELFVSLFGPWDRIGFLVGALYTGLAYLFVWRLARRIVGPLRSLIAVMVLGGTYYFTSTNIEFNHNVAELPVLALFGWIGHRALSENRLVDWALLGLAATLCMLGKYSGVLLLVTFPLFMLVNQQARALYRRPGPYVALAVFLATLSPHLMALWRIDFMPLRFPFERGTTGSQWSDHLLFPVQFLGAQLASVAGGLLLILALRLRRSGDDVVDAPAVPSSFDRAYVTWIALGPVILCMILSAILGFRPKDMWGSAMWDFLGLFSGIALIGEIRRSGFRLFVGLWAFLSIAYLGAEAVKYTIWPYIQPREARGLYPGPALAKAIGDGWQGITGRTILPPLIGPMWTTGNAAFYGAGRPPIMIDGDPVKSPWVTPDMLARQGGILLWEKTGDSPAPSWVAKFPDAALQPDLHLAWQHPAVRKELVIGWAILLPKL